MKNKTSSIKSLISVILFPLFFSIFMFIIGNTGVALLLLGVIVLIFVGYGLSKVLTSSQMRESFNHLTEDEHKQFDKIVKGYSVKMTIFFAIPAGILVGIIYYYFQLQKPLLFVLVFVFIAVGIIPFGIKQRKMTKRFLSNTEWIKNQKLQSSAT
ncbi:MAG: hypothetical protein QME64_02440, partial [bacterium]|nr:hypothetical protein [bacterium]